MSSDTNRLLEQWNELRTVVAACEIDVLKNANGNSSAGVRARHGLRLVQKKSASLVKALLEHDKIKRESDK